MDLDRDTLEELAKAALERPSNAVFYDDRLFDTHGAMFSWAEQSDSIVDESNYLTALELIKGAAGDDADEHIIDGTERHFACGYMRVLYVQVYETYEDEECDCAPTWEHEDDCEHDEDSFYCELYCRIECDGEECLPDEPEFTAAFKEAAELVEYLRGGGAILDDSDYSERESAAFEEALKEAIEQAQRNYYDTCEQDDKIAERFYEDESTTHRNQWCHPDDVCWVTVAEEYEAARDEYFDELAYEIYRWNVLGYNPNQLELDFAV
ncbi:hypothetical protein [Streptomyces sp. NPDC055793]